MLYAGTCAYAAGDLEFESMDDIVKHIYIEMTRAR
jgi:hypothetical protein